MPKIAFVTCLDIPERDVDEEFMLGACRQAGIDAEMAAWDDPEVDWSSYRMAVVRSTWNYYTKPDRFRDWIERVNGQTLLWNDAGLMLRTLHKSYLIELERSGIPIVPTRIVGQGQDACLKSLVEELGASRFVVKPAVSASSFMTKGFSLDELDEAKLFVEPILRAGDAMVQPYMSRVQDGGEVSLIHIDGTLTHAIQKFPRFAGQDESVSKSSVETDQRQRELARAIMTTVSEPWLYARVDLMQTDEGEWVLSELEVIEPSLYLTQYPPALARFVVALLNRLHQSAESL